MAEVDFNSISTYGEFLELKQTDQHVHLTGLNTTSSDVPHHFLMDAKATDGESSMNTLVVLNNGNLADNTHLYASLRRAAAKVVIRITAGGNVQFMDFDQTEGGELISDGGVYYIQNLAVQAFLLAEAKDDETINSDVVTLRNTQKNDGNFDWAPEKDNKNAGLVAYVYANSWTTTDIMNNETCAIVNLPMIYTPDGQEPVECHNSWYKIRLTGENVLRRNNYYEVKVDVNRPGATSETTPVDIENVHFAVQEWEPYIIDVGGDDKPRYLSVNETAMEMHNIATDATTL